MSRRRVIPSPHRTSSSFFSPKLMSPSRKGVLSCCRRAGTPRLRPGLFFLGGRMGKIYRPAISEVHGRQVIKNDILCGGRVRFIKY